MTPVMAIRPTFCEKDVFGRPPNMPATADPKPSAIVPPSNSSLLASRLAPPFVIPEISPTVSTALTNYIKHVPIIAKPSMSKFQSNFVTNGMGNSNQLALPTFAQLTIPNNAATI